MAKANFHKNQRVYVKPVGTWAVIEKVKPQWVKDVEEPVRVYYDCGLGRDFKDSELSLPKEDKDGKPEASGRENWRLMRAKNKWQDADATANHPFPGTFPVVVTDEKDWGGWRVPGQEYDRDPYRIERQARIVASGVRMYNLARKLTQQLDDMAGDAPEEILQLGREAREILRYVDDTPQGLRALKAAE